MWDTAATPYFNHSSGYFSKLKPYQVVNTPTQHYKYSSLQSILYLHPIFPRFSFNLGSLAQISPKFTMPYRRFSGSVSSPTVDFAIDMGNPFLNHTVDGFLKIGVVFDFTFYSLLILNSFWE
jgi:hypothetical protein